MFPASIKKKRKRQNLDKEQVLVLERAFRERSYPTNEEKVMLADRLNMEPHRIAKWFDNRRSRQRTMPKPLPLNSPDMEEQKGKRGRRKRSTNPPEIDLRIVVAQTMDELQKESASQTLTSISGLIPTKFIPDDESSGANSEIPRGNLVKVYKIIQQNLHLNPKFAIETSIKYINHLTWFMVQCAAEALLLGAAIRQMGANFEKILSLLNKAKVFDEDEEDIDSEDSISTSSSFFQNDAHTRNIKKWENFDSELQLYFVVIWQLLGGSQNDSSPLYSVQLNQTGYSNPSTPNSSTNNNNSPTIVNANHNHIPQLNKTRSSARRSTVSTELNYGQNIFWMKDAFHEWFQIYVQACKFSQIQETQCINDLASNLDKVLKNCLMEEEMKIFPFVSSHGSFWEFVLSLIHAGLQKNIPSFLQSQLNFTVVISPNLSNEYTSFSEEDYGSSGSEEDYP